MNYPGGLKKTFKKIYSHKNRGMALEEELNLTCHYYLSKHIAVIHKKPTPICVVKVDYTNKDALIKEAFFEKPSTTDYNGIYKGRYIDFEAKETTNQNYFPLSNIHDHQIKHLEDIINMGGIGFLIIRFTTLNLTYYLDGSKLLEFIKNENRKSVPITYFQTFGYLIKDGLNPRIDFLKIIDNLYFKGE